MTRLPNLPIGLLLAVVSVLPPVAADAADPCRDLGSVRESADLARNSQMGGHVKAHVLGETPPPGQSQEGRTLFAAKGKYNDVWGRYRRGTPAAGVVCSGSGQKGQNVPADAMSSTQISAYSCRAADAAGKCTAWDEYVAASIQFYFIQSGGQWILTTAYPIPLQ